MKTIEIEDDVYALLLQNAEKIGESASEILRRLLEIPPQKRKPRIMYSMIKQRFQSA
jgi:negative regulator of replication initiation